VTRPFAGDQELMLQEYHNTARLAVRRRTHELYTVEPVDFGRWILQHVAWEGGEQVLDVGCGPGDLLYKLAERHGDGRLVGLDLSSGMVTAAAELGTCGSVHFLVGDAQSLPFVDATFDVVMARHMLYLVPDIDRAVASAARVLRPGGQFLAVTNSAHTMPEYRDLRQRAADRFPSMRPVHSPEERFSLENGPSWLQPHLDSIETRTLVGTLRFPAATPLVEYFASSRFTLMRPVHSDVEWQEVLRFFRGEVEGLIQRQGHLDVTKVAGVILGSR
jgi:SAM-dependent methyltransferase